MNVARAYEARCDLIESQYEAMEAANDVEDKLIDSELERIEDTENKDRCRARIAESISDNVDPDELSLLLADLRITAIERGMGRAGSKEHHAEVIDLLDQMIYDAECAEAQREVRQRHAR